MSVSVTSVVCGPGRFSGVKNAWWGPGAEVSVTRGVEGVATCCCDLHDLGRLSAVDVRDRLTACLERF
jgi:hypothetical protein